MTSIDPWFLYQLKEIAALEIELLKHTAETLTPELLRQAKRAGISDERLALSIQAGVQAVRQMREERGIRPVL